MIQHYFRLSGQLPPTTLRQKSLPQARIQELETERLGAQQ